MLAKNNVKQVMYSSSKKVEVIYCQKKLKLKVRSNLTKDERRALKELQRDNKLRVYELDKGCELAIHGFSVSVPVCKLSACCYVTEKFEEIGKLKTGRHSTVITGRSFFC